MQEAEAGRGEPIGPRDWLKIVPFEAAASSDPLGWAGLKAGTKLANGLHIPPGVTCPSLGLVCPGVRNHAWLRYRPKSSET